jgi:hypothetical protein
MFETDHVDLTADGNSVEKMENAYFISVSNSFGHL